MKRFVPDLEKLRSPLARRLIVAIIVVSSTITLCLSALQLYGEYRSELGGIQAVFRQVEEVHLKSLSQSLWATNEAELQLQIEGIARVPNLEYIVVREGDRIWAQAGHRTSRKIIERQYQMIFVHRGQTREIGTLTVVAGLDAVYRGLVNRAVIILASNAFKTFLVAGFAFAFFHWLVNRHLLFIAGYLRGVALSGRAPPLILARAAGGLPDELDEVTAQLNHMLDVLDKAEQRLSSIIASAMDPIVTINENHEITLVNAAVEQMFGYSEADLLGKPVSILIPERYHRAHEKHIRDFAGTNVTKRAMGRFGEVMGRRASGQEFPLDASISQMESGGQRLFTVILRDITRRIEAEKALRKNYELLDRIFATTHFCVVCLDRELNFARVNKAYADACGHPPEFFPGKNHFDLYPGKKVEAIFRRVVATGEPFTICANPFEFPDHPERGVTYWDWTLHPLRGEGGDVEGLLFVLLDVTERKRAEQELQHKTEMAQLLERLARAANGAVSPEAAMETCLRRICEDSKWALGRVATFSPGLPPRKPDRSQWFCTEPERFDAFMRYSNDYEFMGGPSVFINLVLRDQCPVWLPDLTALDTAKLGRFAMAAEAGLNAAFAFPVIVRGEVAAFLEFFATETRQPDALLIEGTTGLAGQIARLIERQWSERVNTQLAAIVESSNDAILIRGLDRTILSWNAAAERLFGWTAQEAVGQSIDLIIPPERIGAMRPFIERAARGEQISPVENINLHKDGSHIPTQVTFSAIKDGQGNVVAYSFIARDITELKRNEDALRNYAARLREYSRRLREVEESERRAISRELHDRIGQGLTTLGLMVGVLDARLSTESRNAVQTLLKDMQALVQYAVAHVRDVMAELRPPVLDDYGLLAALRHLATEFANRTGIAANLGGVDPYPRLPLIVETAMFRISQEALNNIAKHAHAKKVEISLNPASERVVLDIADDGVGFDTSNIADGGEHWGIITMRERAEAVGIRLHLESAPGAGTRIVLEVERAAT